MTPAEHVQKMIDEYSEEEMQVTARLRDLDLPLRRKERDWAIKILLVSFLNDLITLKAEIHERENYTP